MAKLSKKNEELLKAVQKQAAREQAGAHTAREQVTRAQEGAQAAREQAGAQAAREQAGAHEGEQAAREQAETQAETQAGAQHTSVAPPAVNKNSASASSPAVGLGVDLIEIERMEHAIERTPRILERVFTNGEREYAWSKARPGVQYAQFFAAREAVLKALGCGFAGVRYDDVEVTHNKHGKPLVVLHGNALTIAQQQGITEIEISLSNTHQMAVASAVAIKEQSKPQKPEVIDPMEELARQFKELRSLLDDMGMSDIIDADGTEDTSEVSEPTEDSNGQTNSANKEELCEVKGHTRDGTYI